MPSFSAILCASSGCERPENSIRRFDGPRSIQCSGLSSGFASATSSPGRRVSSVVVAVSTEVSLFRDLPGWKPCQRFGRDVICYVRPARDPCVVPDLDRGLEPIVNTGPDVTPDLRPTLRPARLMRVIRGDRPGADVCVLADLRVADVGEVRHLRAGADLRVLDLDERAGFRPDVELRPGTEVTERADPDSLAVRAETALGVGEIELSLRVLRLLSVEGPPETRLVEDVDGGVDLADPQLLVRRVARLDDRIERVIAVSDDAAVRTRVRRLEG